MLSGTLMITANTYIISHDNICVSVPVAQSTNTSEQSPVNLFQNISNYISDATIVLESNSSSSKCFVRILSTLKNQDRRIFSDIFFNRYIHSDVFLPPVDYYVFGLKKIVV